MNLIPNIVAGIVAGRNRRPYTKRQKIIIGIQGVILFAIFLVALLLLAPSW